MKPQNLQFISIADEFMTILSIICYTVYHWSILLSSQGSEEETDQPIKGNRYQSLHPNNGIYDAIVDLQKKVIFWVWTQHEPSHLEMTLKK